MKRIAIPVLAFLALLVFTVSTVSASRGTLGLPAGTEGPALVPGNYCVSCHLADDPRLRSVTAWTGGIAREVNSPCPAAAKIHEELYYTERLLLMIARAEAEVGPLPAKAQSRLDDYTQRYSRLLDAPITSLEAFVSEAQTTRYQLNKVYTTLNDMAEAAKRRTVLLYAGIATLIVLGSLAWGLYNTRAVRAGMLSKSWASFWRLAFVLAVLAFFALPVFRVPAAEVEMTTLEQQEAQTTLDTAQRAADAADRAQARAWMLAQTGSAWREADRAQAQSILDESLVSLETARQNEEALWGQSLAVQEVTVGTKVEMESAGLIAADLNAARARAWAVPLVAVEMNALDPAQAAALLQAEQSRLENQTGIYRDLQLRGLSLAWAKVDPAQASPAAAIIADPAIRAWTFRELAVLTHTPSLFTRALEAARQIEDPVRQARALGEIAVASGKSAIFDEALSALEDVTGAPLAYALGDLAAASGDASLVNRIEPAYPEARACALLRMGEYPSAWVATDHILDPYEQARARSAIAAAWGNAEAAAQVSIPLYRDLALREIVRQTGEAALVELISSPYYKIQALTALGDYESASQLAADLGDKYPLVELAVSLAGKDSQAALSLVDRMDREADKAVALQAVALASQDRSLIEKAQGMALAARVRGDSLAPASALLDLARALFSVNTTGAQAVLQQAFEAAQRIATK